MEKDQRSTQLGNSGRVDFKSHRKAAEEVEDGEKITIGLGSTVVPNNKFITA